MEQNNHNVSAAADEDKSSLGTESPFVSPVAPSATIEGTLAALDTDLSAVLFSTPDVSNTIGIINPAPIAPLNQFPSNNGIAPRNKYGDRFPNHIVETATETMERGAYDVVTQIALPGQYYYSVCGLILPIIKRPDLQWSNIGPYWPDVEVINFPQYATAQVERFLETTELAPPMAEWNAQPADASTKFFGQTLELPLWEKEAFQGSPEQLKAYEEFVISIDSVFASCAMIFQNVQPRVHREALRLRDLCIAAELEPANAFPQAARTCFKTMRIVTNCAMKPGHLAPLTIPWVVVAVLGFHIDGGMFLIATGEGDLGWRRGRRMIGSMSSDVLVVNNERPVGNEPFKSEGTGMYQLQLFLPEMGHEFDTV